MRFISGCTYIKVTGARVEHLYRIEWYSSDGTLVDSTLEKLGDIDKCTTVGKLRVSSPWGRLSTETILGIGTPKFMRVGG